MTRVFRRGELKSAVLAALAMTGPANGYTIMQALADQVGGAWKPSPGAVYPALLGLEDAGLVAGRDQDGARVYELTDAGRRAQEAEPDVIADVAARSRATPPRTTVGRLLDELAARHALRHVALLPDQERAVAAVLRRASDDIERITTMRRR